MAGPVRIAILANASQATRTFNQTANSAQSMGQRVSGSFKKMAVPAVAALGAIGAAAKKSIDAASDLAETSSKSEVIFGKQSGAIAQFAKDAEQSLGQSQTAALDAAATFGQIGQKAGLSGKEAAGFAKEFTTLASDLASFSNTSPEEAVTAIGAAMRGESEPIRKYGVLLDDATLRAEALKLGLIKTTSQALTPQNKALAASSAIMAQTGKAQGDFARTSEGAANQSRILAAQSENLQAKLGTQLLPIYVKLQTVLGTVLDFLSRHQSTVQAVVIVVAALAAGVLIVNGVMAVAGAVTATYTAITAACALAQKAATAASLGTRIGLAALAVQTVVTSTVTKAAAAAQWLLNAAMTANPIGLVVVAIVALVAAFVIAYKKSETFRKIVDKAFSAIKSVVKSAVSFLAPFIKGAFNAIKAVFTTYFKIYATIVKTAWNVIKTVTKVAWTLIKTVIIEPIKAALSLLRSALGNIKSALSDAWNTAKSVTKAAWDGLKNAITNTVGAVVSFVRGIPGKILGALGSLGSLLFNAGKSIIQGLIDGISSMIGAVTSKLKDLTSLIPKVKGPPDKDKVLLYKAGRLIIDGLIKGFEDGRDGIKKSLGDITKLIEETMAKRYKKNDKRAKAATKKAIASLKDETKALLKNAKQREKIYKKLDKAEALLADRRKVRDDYAKSVASAATGYASITALDTAFNSDAIITGLKGRLEKLKQFAAILKDLIAKGLNATQVDQLAQAGVEGGLATALAIQQGGTEAVKELNAVQAQIASASTGLGNTVANDMYGAGVQVAAGLVRGLKSQEKQIENIAKRLANTLAKAVKNALQIKSPSRVFAELGKQTALGLTVGLGDVNVARSGERLADTLQRGFGTPALNAYADVNGAGIGSTSGNTYNINVTAPIGSNPAEIGRTITSYIDAYEMRGGKRRAA